MSIFEKQKYWDKRTQDGIMGLIIMLHRAFQDFELGFIDKRQLEVILSQFFLIMRRNDFVFCPNDENYLEVIKDLKFNEFNELAFYSRIKDGNND